MTCVFAELRVLTHLTMIDGLVIVAYLAGMVALGLLFSKQSTAKGQPNSSYSLELTTINYRTSRHLLWSVKASLRRQQQAQLLSLLMH